MNCKRRFVSALVLTVGLLIPLNVYGQSDLAAWFGQERLDSTTTTTQFQDDWSGQDANGGFRNQTHSNGSLKSTLWAQAAGPSAKRGFGSNSTENYSRNSSGYGSSSPNNPSGAFSSNDKSTIIQVRTPYVDPNFGTISGEFVDYKATYHIYTSPAPEGGNPPDLKTAYQWVDPMLNIELANASSIYYACKAEDKYSYLYEDLPSYKTSIERTTTAGSSRVPALIYQKFTSTAEPTGTVRKLCWTMTTAVVPYSVFGGLGGYWPGGTVLTDGSVYNPTSKSYCMYPSRSNGGQQVVNGPAVSNLNLATNTCRLYYFQIDSFDRVKKPSPYTPDTIFAVATTSTSAAKISDRPVAVVSSSPSPSPSPSASPKP